MSKPSHIYAIWKYDNNPNTIDDHIEIMGSRDGHIVKWLIVYNLEDEKFFKRSLPESKIEEICLQCENKKIESILFLQCLELFRAQLYAGLIEKIEPDSKARILTNPKEPVPSYYSKLLRRSDIEILCSITLSKLEPIDTAEVHNLVPRKAEIPARSEYNLPRIVYQKDVHSVFSKKSPLIGKLTLDQKHRERARAVARLLWRLNPQRRIAEIYKDENFLEIALENERYTEATMRRWIHDLCPNPQKGRPPKK